MANPEHLAKLNEGVEAWNHWRTQNTGIKPDLRKANLIRAQLSGANLREANLREANLSEADLSEADLHRASLSGANLRAANLSAAHVSRASLNQADLHGANLSGANLYLANFADADLSEAKLRKTNLGCANLHAANLNEADLIEANLRRTDLSWTDLSSADLTRANLREAVLIRTNLGGASLTACSVYGISAWNVNLAGARQSNLVITPSDEAVIQVDNLEVAQFIYLLLNNEKIRQVIDTITSKVVLILGRFTSERKAVLDAIREELRKRNYLPVLFDFEKPSNRDITETVRILAHMARFVIADITDAKSIPQELMAIVPNLPSVPVQPVLSASQHEYGMFEHFRRYPWVLEPVLYETQEALLLDLEPKVIVPAETKANERTQK